MTKSPAEPVGASASYRNGKDGCHPPLCSTSSAHHLLADHISYDLHIKSSTLSHSPVNPGDT